MNQIIVIVLGLSISFSSMALASDKNIAETIGFKGGFIVHVGGDTTLTTTLGASNHRSVVQGLFCAAKDVDSARKNVQSSGDYGRISVSLYDGKNLPYVDSLVNLLVVSDKDQLSADEIKRVLAPNGMALVKNGEDVPDLSTLTPKNLKGWSVFKKPWSKDIDEWTHFEHDTEGSFVSNDMVVDDPKGLRWTCGPFWARSHEHTSSMQAMVSAQGRVFYVMDEGSTESIQLPAEVYLTARDAFNGTILWKRPLHDWSNFLFPLKSGPGWMPRRLVAVGGRVYIAPGLGQNILCLDAITGDIIRTYPETPSSFELVVSDGVVFAAVDPDEKECDYNQQNANCWKERDRASRKWGWNLRNGNRVIKAIQGETGKLLWEKKTPLAPMTLSANGDVVCMYDGGAVLALDQHNGRELWKTDVVVMNEIRTGYAGPRLIISNDKVLFSPKGKIFAISLKTGKILWSAKKKPSGHFSIEDLFVVDNKVWALHSQNGAFTTYDLEDGKLLKDYKNYIKSFYIHQRCYPGRATQRLMLPPVMGLQTYDIKKDKWTNNHWARGTCLYGEMPANGMIYTAPTACACYYQSTLRGFNVFAPNSSAVKSEVPEQRLVKGSAYGKFSEKSVYADSEWSTFRHDNTRSGYVRTDVPSDIAVSWKKDFGTKLSQPTVAGGKVFFSAVNKDTVYAVDASSGKMSWSFIAGGRVDSAPTIYKGLAVFGCSDGCVYALTAKDGEVVWKFHAAPSDRKLMAFNQPESVWPLSGSVLIQDGKIYCVAGRSTFVDGGLRMLILKPETGELISENIMGDTDPATGKNLQALMTGKHMPIALPDILSSDGKYVYMKSQTFKMDGKRLRVFPQRPDTQYGDEVHLFSPITFLDDSWQHRTYWIYGRAAGEGWAEFQIPPKRVPCGHIMCIDDKNAYSYGREPGIMCNSSVNEYRLFSALKTPARKVDVSHLEGKWPKHEEELETKSLAGSTVDWKQLSQQPADRLSALKYNWIHDEPDVVAKAMVLANDRLFVAGPRDMVDEISMWGKSNEDEFKQKMQKQSDWLKGKYGAFLQVFSKKDGKKLSEIKLDYLPSFDGMVAANGKLYIITQSGSIFCYKGKL